MGRTRSNKDRTRTESVETGLVDEEDETITAPRSKQVVDVERGEGAPDARSQGSQQASAPEQPPSVVPGPGSEGDGGSTAHDDDDRPKIVEPPDDQRVDEGKTASFRARAEGDKPFTFIWTRESGDVVRRKQKDEVVDTLDVPATRADDGSTFTLVVEDKEKRSSEPASASLNVRVGAPLTWDPDFTKKHAFFLLAVFFALMTPFWWAALTGDAFAGYASTVAMLAAAAGLGCFLASISLALLELRGRARTVAEILGEKRATERAAASLLRQAHGQPLSRPVPTLSSELLRNARLVPLGRTDARELTRQLGSLQSDDVLVLADVPEGEEETVMQALAEASGGGSDSGNGTTSGASAEGTAASALFGSAKDLVGVIPDALANLGRLSPPLALIAAGLLLFAASLTIALSQPGGSVPPGGETTREQTTTTSTP